MKIDNRKFNLKSSQNGKLISLGKLYNFSNKETIVYATSVVIIFFIKYLFLNNYLTKSNFKTPDSLEYLQAAANFKETYFGIDPNFTQLSLTRLPGYPFFISLFDSHRTIILVQVLMQCSIGIVLVVMFKMISLKRLPKICFMLFILTQIDSSLSVYSYRLLSETLFSFMLLLLIAIIAKRLNNNRKIALDAFITVLILVCFLIRPVAIYFLFIFLIMIFISTKKTLFINLFMITIIVYGSYCGFNYYKNNIFVYTLIQNSNLLFYEGAGAKAISSSRPLESIQTQEEILRRAVIGPKATLEEVNSYNLKRGIKLIYENKYSFIKMHLIGSFKLLYGPNRAELRQIFTDSGRNDIPESLWAVIFSIYFGLTFVISTLGVIGCLKYFFINDTFKLISLTIFVFIALTSSSLAYGRFRTPISALLIFYAVLFVINWKDKRPIFFKWHKFTKKFKSIASKHPNFKNTR